MEINSLIGYQRAEFELAKRRDEISSTLERLVFLTSCVAVFINDPAIKYIASAITVFCLLASVYLKIRSRAIRAVAERARRICLLISGLGLDFQGKLMSDLMSDFASTPQQAKKFEVKNYFASDLPPGKARLAKILEESLFWSKNLYKECRRDCVKRFCFGALLSLMLLIALPLIKDNGWKFNFAELASIFVAWIITVGFFSDALSYQSAVYGTDRLEQELSGEEKTDSTMIAIMGDYNSIVESTPLIPSNIYDNKKDFLNELWSRRA